MWEAWSQCIVSPSPSPSLDFVHPAHAKPCVAPLSTPCVAPLSTPCVAPLPTPCVAPLSTPCVAPLSTPCVAPLSTPCVAPLSTPCVAPLSTPWSATRPIVLQFLMLSDWRLPRVRQKKPASPKDPERRRTQFLLVSCMLLHCDPSTHPVISCYMY